MTIRDYDFRKLSEHFKCFDELIGIVPNLRVELNVTYENQKQTSSIRINLPSGENSELLSKVLEYAEMKHLAFNMRKHDAQGNYLELIEK